MHEFAQTLGQSRAVEAIVGAFAPLHLKRIRHLDGRPSAVRNHRHTAQGLKHAAQANAIQRLHGDETGLCRRFFKARDSGTQHRRADDHGVGHVRQRDVHAEGGLAVHHVVRVHMHAGLADVVIVRPALELGVRGHRQFGRRRNQSPIAQRAAGWRMAHFVLRRLALRHRHAPLLRRGLTQHLPRRGTGFTQRVEEQANALGTIRVLVAVHRVANRLLDGDGVPIRLQFVGDDLGKGGAHPLAHLGTAGGDRHAAIAVNGEEHIGCQGGGAGIRAGDGAQNRRRRTQHEGRAPLHEAPARQVGGGGLATAGGICVGLGTVHVRCPATSLMAARMRP